MSDRPYNVFRWWKACVETRVVTEDGAYAEGEVPEGYGGPQLEMKILQRVLMTNSSGEIFELRLDNLADVLDKDSQGGLGADITLPGNLKKVIAPTGPSSKKVTWALVSNPQIDGATDARANVMWKNLAAQENIN